MGRPSQLTYNGTAIFCDRFIDKRSLPFDQMVQAARSGVQNSAEGSLASATSKETELALTNVASASSGKLLLDYEDFLAPGGLRERMTKARLEARGRTAVGLLTYFPAPPGRTTTLPCPYASSSL